MERPIRYIRESFFYGRQFVNDEDLNEQALVWLEGTANVRRHGTTGERPVDRFERDERQALQPLASAPYRRLGARRAPQPARRPIRPTPAPFSEVCSFRLTKVSSFRLPLRVMDEDEESISRETVRMDAD